MQFNQYSLYSMAFNQEKKDDIVDSCLKDLRDLSRYEEVRKYVESKFGNIDGEKLIEYDDINKQIHIVLDDERVEVCAAKDWTQYYGKGWLLVSKKK